MRPLLVASVLVLTVLAGCADPMGDGALRGAQEHGGGGHRDHTGGHGDGGSGGHGQSHAGQTGMERPLFPAAQGRVPSADEASRMPQVPKLRLIGDQDLDASGYAAGNGTLEDPYVIEGLYVTGDVLLQDTDACVVLRGNFIGGHLKLNWNGQCVHVHHNHIRDLRVNENIRRTGYATGGYIEHNEISIVGQLRHYDGVFGHNVVGPMPEGGPLGPVMETTPLLAPEHLIANIDGFNQGIVHNNTFHGSVDLDFHGHHHGTGFYAPHSHYHGDDDERGHDHDHTQRWTSVRFVDNVVIDDEGYGLRYEDRNHAGDDRRAASEQEEELEEDHFHRTDIVLARNTVRGAGIWIDVFNADDARHKERNDGWLTIEDNVVHIIERDPGPLGAFGTWRGGVGYQVQLAKEVDLRISGNHATFEARERGLLDALDPEVVAVAYDVDRLKDSVLVVEKNGADGFDVGMRAARFEDVAFTFRGNDFGSASEPTAFDDSVT